MKESTLVLNLSAAPSVIRNSQMAVVGRDMKEPTLVLNHSAAANVTTNAQTKVI